MSFGEPTNARYGVVMGKVDKRGNCILFFAKVYILLWLGCRGGCEKRAVAFVQKVKVIAPSNLVEHNLGCICVS